MPPPVYGSPAMRAANSAARSPANTRWLWLSTKPGITAAPRGVEPLVGGGRVRGRADPRDPASPTTIAASRRIVAQLRIVGGQLADVRDQERHVIASRSSRATSTRDVPPVADDLPAVGHDVGDVGGGRGEDARPRGSNPAVRGRVQRDRDQVGARARPRCARRRASPGRVAGGGGRGEQLGRGEVAALLGGAAVRPARRPAPPRTGR